MQSNAHPISSSDQRPVMRPVIRKDARAKVTGAAKYVDDLVFPDMIYGVTVRSKVARGKILGVHFEGNIPWDEITVVTTKDLPGPNSVAHILRDQQCLAGDVIQHPDEAILLLAHSDRELLEEARKHVRVDVEEMPGVFTIDESLAQKQIIWGKDNSFKKILIEKGNVENLFDKAKTSDAVVVEGEYTTKAQEHAYIEPNGMIAVATKDQVTVWGSMQCPYYVHHALMELLKLPKEKVRVIQTETGGGFGGKEDFPSVIACHAALLSLKSGKPVKIIYNRSEDMAATTKRHPSKTKHRTVVSKEGKLLAMDIEFYLDGGAYATMSPVVLSRGAIHAAGVYDCPNIRIRANAVATNTPPHGAFRGFGAPQSIFALECQMDKVAENIRMSPEQLRKRNFVHEGSLMATGQKLREKVDLEGLLEQAFAKAQYHKKRLAFAENNAESTNPVKRGIGFSIFMHGGGFTGSGEKNLASIVGVEAFSDGHVEVLASTTEIGQGERTVFAQIASSALDLPYEQVETVVPDTDRVPNSGPTVASRTTMVVGKLVEVASYGLKQTLKHAGFLRDKYTAEEFTQACAQYIEKFGKLQSFTQYEQPPHIQWDDATYKGDAYGTFAWGVYVAEVSVDTRTYEVKVEHFVAAQEIGKVMHPVLAAGQIEGGVVQGIGYAIYEDVLFQKGHMTNNRLTNYIIPTAQDSPEIDVIFVEEPYLYGPQGAKGIGELPLDGVGPAVANAVSFALNKRAHQIPLLPEVVMDLCTDLHQKGARV